jgi:hypothetical protein
LDAQGVSIRCRHCKAFLGITAAVVAQEKLAVDINRISSSGVGEKIGKVAISQSKYGASFEVSVWGCHPGNGAFTFTRRVTFAPA